MPSVAARLVDALGDGLLAERLPVVGEPFLARRAGDAATARLDGDVLRGLARVLATSAESARLLAARPALLERIAGAAADPRAALERRAEALSRDVPAEPDDLEDMLDGLRLLRREETLFAACLDLGDATPFPAVSTFLSRLAETVLGRALARAQALSSLAPGDAFSVVGMGKIGGREFTYHSDLDLLFLYAGGPEGIVQASRVGQRLVSYLTTMTRAGVAYPVDTRLRPSGNQGLLVTSFDAYARYQREDAQPWEHLVLMRARAVAGDVARAGEVVERVRDQVLREAEAPWPEVARMRERVERERGAEGDGSVAYKTGAGGLMDVDFLAAGARLERGAETPAPPLPSNAGLLRSAIQGPRVEALLAAYDFLRRVEARNRWVAGRAVEAFDPRGEGAPLVVALTAPDDGLGALIERIAETRALVRAAFRAVVHAGTIEVLGEEPTASAAAP